MKRDLKFLASTNINLKVFNIEVFLENQVDQRNMNYTYLEWSRSRKKNVNDCSFHFYVYRTTIYCFFWNE